MFRFRRAFADLLVMESLIPPSLGPIGQLQAPGTPSHMSNLLASMVSVLSEGIKRRSQVGDGGIVAAPRQGNSDIPTVTFR